jgi:hypothetical protein
MLDNETQVLPVHGMVAEVAECRTVLGMNEILIGPETKMKQY